MAVRTGLARAIHSSFASAAQPWSHDISGAPWGASRAPMYQAADAKDYSMWETHNTRKPRLLLRLPGWVLLR